MNHLRKYLRCVLLGCLLMGLYLYRITQLGRFLSVFLQFNYEIGKRESTVCMTTLIGLFTIFRA